MAKSLIACLKLKTHQDKFSEFEQDEIKKAAENLSSIGYKGQDASIRAVEDIISGLLEQRENIITQIEEQLGIKIEKEIDNA